MQYHEQTRKVGRFTIVESVSIGIDYQQKREGSGFPGSFNSEPLTFK